MEAPASPGSEAFMAKGLEPPFPTSLAGSELDDAICRICQDYLTDPVTIECGHNFCRACITQQWEGEETPSCPQCREMLQKRALRSNKQLDGLVQFIKQLGLTRGQRRADGNVCVEHGKELVWFCKKDAKRLCEDCRGSPVHHSHAVVPMGKTAHQSKGEASTSIRSEDGTIREQEAISTPQQELRAMASDHHLQKLLEEAVCPICMNSFKDPVTIDCGHNFCRACVTQHYGKWEKEPEGVCCPQCRTKLKKEEFQTNRQLASMVENIQQLLGIKPENLKKQTVCREHDNKIKLFCEDDGEVICQICDKPQKHKSHTLVPIEEAAQKYKDKFDKDIKLLKEALKEISELEFKEQDKPNDWKRKVKLRKQRILMEFEKLERFLSEEKNLVLQRLVEEKTETLKKIKENVTKLSQQSSSLQQLIAEIERKCQQPATELLKDVKDTLARSEQVRLHKPDLTFTELTGLYRVPGMLEMLREFTVDVTLDPDTANPWLILSEDRKRVRHGDTRQDLPDNPERFDTYPCVLGSEGFTGGRHYWEVEVGDKTEWILGVCRQSVSKKGQVTLCPEDGYWTVWLEGKEYKALTAPPVLLPVNIRPSRVGIFLDYEESEVSFYNVTDRSHLFTFTGTFSGTLRPYFYTGHNKGGDNVAPLIIWPVPT